MALYVLEFKIPRSYFSIILAHCRSLPIFGFGLHLSFRHFYLQSELLNLLFIRYQVQFQLLILFSNR